MSRQLRWNSRLCIALRFTTILIVLAALAAPAQNGAGRRTVQHGTAPTQLASSSQVPPVNFASAVTYSSGGGGSVSIVVADLNGDGHPDLVVVNQNSANVGVLLGNGDGTFQPAATCWSGGEWPSSVAVGDVNGDGHPDLVVANSSDHFNTVGVLLGNGNGTFQRAVTYGTGGRSPLSVAIGDVNEDGRPDLAIANSVYSGGGGNGAVGVLLGNGDGTFRPAVPYNSGAQEAHSVAIGDLNGDGHPDVIVVNAGTGIFGVLLGNGDGTFQPVVLYTSGGWSWSVAIADVNSDGHPDLAVANWVSQTVGVLLGNGDGTFQPAITNSSGARSWSVAVADLNGDGHADLAVATAGAFVGVMLGVGDGTFQPAASFPVGSQKSWSVAVADVNGDSRADLLVATNKGVAVLLGTQPTTATTLASSLNPSQVGQSVTFTATVTVDSGGGPPDGELVTFYDGITTLASVPLSNGKAAYKTSSLSAKKHTITAKYSGDTWMGPSSGSLRQVVLKYPTTTTLNSSPNPSNYGQTVTFTATVTPSGPYAPTGKVKFLDGTTGIGTAALSGGVAKLKKSTLTVGTHAITAQYLSDAYNSKSTSSVVEQVVQ